SNWKPDARRKARARGVLVRRVRGRAAVDRVVRCTQAGKPDMALERSNDRQARRGPREERGGLADHSLGDAGKVVGGGPNPRAVSSRAGDANASSGGVAADSAEARNVSATSE